MIKNIYHRTVKPFTVQSQGKRVNFDTPNRNVIIGFKRRKIENIATKRITALKNPEMNEAELHLENAYATN